MRCFILTAVGWSWVVSSACLAKEPPAAQPRSPQLEPTAAALPAAETTAGGASGTAAEIFHRRVLPILRSDKASSCTECHFGGVELKNYLREDQLATFAALRDEGLIDVHRPEESKLLQLINRRAENSDPLIEKVRQAELEAMRSWILAAVREPQLLAARATAGRIGTEVPLAVVRHMRRDRVVQSFVENIWSEVGRCIGCHSPDRNQKLVAKHGEQMSWIRPNDPAGTLNQCLEQGIIDTDHPDESLILQKPLTLVEHGGGPKFALGSRTDKNFRRFLADYADVVNKNYRTQDQLPAAADEVAVLTGQHLRIVGLPQRLDKKLLRVDLYRWLGDRWSDSPWGTADNPINGKQQVWQSMIFAVAPRGSQRGGALAIAAGRRNAVEVEKEQPVQLPAGRYLIKIYVDQLDKAQQNRDYELGGGEIYGEVEIEGEWRPGYQPPKIVSAPAERPAGPR